MKKLIHCRNYNCKFYYEDGCFSEETMIIINCDGECETFEKGINDMYLENEGSML